MVCLNSGITIIVPTKASGYKLVNGKERVSGRACERSGAGRFAAPSLKPFLLHPAPHSDPRSGHFSKAANCSAPIQPIF